MIFQTNQDYEILSMGVLDLKDIRQKIFPQIREILRSLHVPDGGYVLDGEGMSGELSMNLDGDVWAVYSAERGNRYNYAFFSNVWSAGNFFIWELVRTSKASPNIPHIKFEV